MHPNQIPQLFQAWKPQNEKFPTFYQIPNPPGTLPGCDNMCDVFKLKRVPYAKVTSMLEPFIGFSHSCENIQIESVTYMYMYT